MIGYVLHLSLDVLPIPSKGLPLSFLTVWCSIAIVSAPYDAVGSDMHPLGIWARSYDVPRRCGVHGVS